MRQENLLVQGLDGPAAIHQPARQIVEQRLIAGSGAAHAEVIECRDQAASEMTLPDPVDDHSRRERIIFAGDPLRQLQTSASLRAAWELAASQRLQESSRGLVS